MVNYILMILAIILFIEPDILLIIFIKYLYNDIQKK